MPSGFQRLLKAVCSSSGTFPEAPSFRSVYVSCEQTPALNVAAACLPNAGDVVLGASSRKPSTHHCLRGLGVCTFPA